MGGEYYLEVDALRKPGASGCSERRSFEGQKEGGPCGS